MAQKILQYEKSNELEGVLEILNSEKSSTLLELISNPKFEFDINQSSRMLNYFEKNGSIRFHREGNGKRRFSLSNAIGFYISQFLKELGKSNFEISQIIDTINTPNDKGISELVELIFVSTLLLGTKEFRIFQDEDNSNHSGNKLSLVVSSDYKETNFSISKVLRNLFFNENGSSVNKGKLISFLSLYLPEVLELLKEMNQLDINNNEIPKLNNANLGPSINSFANLNQLPFAEYEGRFDIIHVDQDDNVFGIEIKQLKIASIRNVKSEKITVNKEQLNKAIDDEINFLIKMKKKISSIK